MTIVSRILVQLVVLYMLSGLANVALADAVQSANAFAQLDQELPTANDYRTASGTPGKSYWQQQADYTIEAELDPEQRSIAATASVRYTNNSPDTLRYLWLQLDQNRWRPDSLDQRSRTLSEDRVTYHSLREHYSIKDSNYGYRNLLFTDANGDPLAVTIVDTMGRLDLPTPLAPGESVTFNMGWQFNITEKAALGYSSGDRGGYEYLEDTNTEIFSLAQWFPRLAAYTDYSGWQHKAYLGRGEFTLEFGDYDVSLTVPDSHIIAATGALQNPRRVLSTAQRERLEDVSAETPSFIVTPEEALTNKARDSEGQKTWRFKAENVRDFAWASSSAFVWDAMLHEQPGASPSEVLAMSYYPGEAVPVWSKFATHAIVHTLDVYNRFAFDYPYPVSIAVNAWEKGGMEYPMINFNGYRPDPPDANDEDPEDAASKANAMQAYSRRVKYGLIGVVIHEVGHNYFPMIVNSDERQWTWMDEGLNTFLEYMAQLEWDETHAGFAGSQNILDYIPRYTTSEDQVPIMTQGDSIPRGQIGRNAYYKPAAALTVLREAVLGRELFDFAFREFSQRWQFKRPTPADFFRSMEDASGVDLDWFWRSWFYSTARVDVAIADVRAYQLKTGDPDIDRGNDRLEHERNKPLPITIKRNRSEGIIPRDIRYEELQDLYSESDPYTVSNKDRNSAKDAYDGLEDWEQRVLNRAVEEDTWFYFVDFANLGGSPTPLFLNIEYEDGSERRLELPAEVWRYGIDKVTYRLIETRPVAAIEVDPEHLTADADYHNNRFPQAIRRSRLEAYKYKSDRRNLMADLLVELKAKSDDEKHDDDSENKAAPLSPSGV